MKERQTHGETERDRKNQKKTERDREIAERDRDIERDRDRDRTSNTKKLATVHEIELFITDVNRLSNQGRDLLHYSLSFCAHRYLKIYQPLQCASIIYLTLWNL